MKVRACHDAILVLPDGLEPDVTTDDTEVTEAATDEFTLATRAARAAIVGPAAAMECFPWYKSGDRRKHE